jgi:pyruvate formate lyase activating enzyme
VLKFIYIIYNTQQRKPGVSIEVRSGIGIIFDIQELAIHDGPGIRITVFMKGCPLNCTWCHNPEGISPEPQVVRSIDGSARVVGKRYTSAGMAHIINSKKDILHANEGGVTFSGGEPLLQADFVAEVVDQLDGVHVLIDTSGYASKDYFTSLVKRSNMVFFDLKLIDSDMHRKYTGVENGPILQNLKLLNNLGVPFVIRVPLVPGITDTDKNLTDIAEIAKSQSGLTGIELLPYNRAAGGKYGSVGLHYSPGFDESVELNINTDIFEYYGLKVKVV